jgi:hypothetical protein
MNHSSGFFYLKRVNKLIFLRSQYREKRARVSNGKIGGIGQRIPLDELKTKLGPQKGSGPILLCPLLPPFGGKEKDYGGADQTQFS